MKKIPYTTIEFKRKYVYLKSKNHTVKFPLDRFSMELNFHGVMEPKEITDIGGIYNGEK